MGFLLLGVDSLIACMAICAIVEPQSRLRLAALFGIADFVGFLIGAGLGWQLAGGVSAVLLTGTLVAVGLYLLIIAAGTRRVAARWPLWVLPWALTVDNLAYGVVGDHSAGSLLQQAGEQALSSALLALVGLLVAVVLPRLVPVMGQRAAATRFAGGALVLAAGGLVLLG
jgi:hypothetical protein